MGPARVFLYLNRESLMGLNSRDGNIKRYAFILTIYLYYLVYQTWSSLVQVLVVQSSASTPSTSVSPPPPPPTHTLYVGWEKGWGERKIIMYGGTPAQFFFSVLTWSFSKHVHHE